MFAVWAGSSVSVYVLAQELGLVPRVNQFDTLWKWGPLARVVLCGEDEYRRRKTRIVEKYCTVDRELRICDYDALTAHAPAKDQEMK